ncbi:MAG: DUF1624 domain-containing protein [Ferrovum sp.]|nr:DUF1624 domain-containing protein [Ferrovum sp.]
MARLALIDRGRGLAIAMMVVFHGCYDSTYFGFTHFDMLGSPFWTTWRTLIVTLFVFLSGISLTLGRQAAPSRVRLRLVKLGASALLVSAVTAVLFGARWIYFGVLHFYFLATLITRRWLGFPKLLGLAGILLLGVGQLGWTSMDPRWLNWIGLAADKPATEDYAPLLPWLGVLWIGVWMGNHPLLHSLSKQAKPPGHLGDRALQGMGRHGLLIYLIHQPILFGLFTALRALQG